MISLVFLSESRSLSFTFWWNYLLHGWRSFIKNVHKKLEFHASSYAYLLHVYTINHSIEVIQHEWNKNFAKIFIFWKLLYHANSTRAMYYSFYFCIKFTFCFHAYLNCTFFYLLGINFVTVKLKIFLKIMSKKQLTNLKKNKFPTVWKLISFFFNFFPQSQASFNFIEMKPILFPFSSIFFK